MKAFFIAVIAALALAVGALFSQGPARPALADYDFPCSCELVSSPTMGGDYIPVHCHTGESCSVAYVSGAGPSTSIFYGSGGQNGGGAGQFFVVTLSGCLAGFCNQFVTASGHPGVTYYAVEVTNGHITSCYCYDSNGNITGGVYNTKQPSDFVQDFGW